MNVIIQNYLLNFISFFYFEFSYLSFNFFVVLPEFLLILFCLLVLLLSYILKIKILFKWSTFFLLFLFTYYLFVIIYTFPFGAQNYLIENFIFTDYFFLFFKSIIIGSTLIIFILSQNIICNNNNTILKEFIFFILSSVFFMLMLLSSNDFLFSYFSIEGMSFSLYILATSSYYNRFSIESAFKYFILGGVASSIFLYGISYIYIISSSLDFFYIKFFLLNNYTTSNFLEILFIISSFSISFLFKLSAFPCHIWAPDVYEGIWTPITAFFAIVVKITLFVFAMRVFSYIFNSIVLWQFFFLISGLGSIIIGCLGALLQKRIKRFLGYTSINQVGFLLLGLSLNSISGLSSSIMFLIIYIIMSLIFFGIILNIKHFTQKFQIIFLTDLYSVSGKNFDINLIWVITLFSMAGIPPLAGFFTKYYILLNLINYSLYSISLIILLLSTLSCFYYLNFIKYLLFEKKKLNTLYFFDIQSLQGIIFIILSISLITFILSCSFLFNQILFLSFCCKYILH